MESTKGDFIKQKLEKITSKVGIPIQIVADNGSDLACGIKLYKNQYENLIYTHDVTHGMALLLKYELNSDEKYQSFINKCNMCRQQLQQTELSFLSPPVQRSQCRYFNIERLTDWGIKILNSQLDTLVELIPSSEPNLIKNKLIDKLGWLADYQSELLHWNQMTMLTRNLETQLKKLGINQESLIYFEENNLVKDNSLSCFKEKI